MILLHFVLIIYHQELNLETKKNYEREREN